MHLALKPEHCMKKHSYFTTEEWKMNFKVPHLFQIIRRFGFSRCIDFTMYLDISVYLDT